MSDKKRVLIVEPHGDDALLSCFSILNIKSENVIKTVLTFSERNSEGLSRYFTNTNNIDNTNFCNDPELGVSICTYHEARSWQKLSADDGDNAFIKSYKKLFSKSPKVSFTEFFSKVLSDDVLKLCEESDLIFIPTGILHPYHMMIASAFMQNLPSFLDKVVLYFEAPYSNKATGKILTDALLEGFSELPKDKDNVFTVNITHSSLTNSERELKELVFTKVYPTEVKLLRFYKDKMFDFPEVFVTVSQESFNKLKEVLTK